MTRSTTQRVFAVRNADQHTVWLYGTGTYLGKHPRPGGLGPFGMTFADMRHLITGEIQGSDAQQLSAFDREMAEFLLSKGEISQREADERITAAVAEDVTERARPMRHRVWDRWALIRDNPMIILDSGQVVFGAQCWWADIDKLDRTIGGRTVVLVADQLPYQAAITAGPAAARELVRVP